MGLSRTEINRINGMKGGRPRRVWTEKEIELFKNLCSIQCTVVEICSVMDVADKTLVELINRHLYEDVTGEERKPDSEPIAFYDAWKKYSSGGRASLRRKQFDKALSGNIPMLIFLGKNYLDQRDVPDTTVNVQPVVIVDDID